MSTRATLRVALVALVLLLAQSTVILSIRVGGMHPDILWLLPITAALLDGPETGAVVGFWSGLAFDLVLPTPFGLSALVGCLLGFAIGVATAAVDPRAVWLRPVAAVIGSVAADMVFAVLGAIFGQQQMVQIDFTSLFVVVAALVDVAEVAVVVVDVAVVEVVVVVTLGHLTEPTEGLPLPEVSALAPLMYTATVPPFSVVRS